MARKKKRCNKVSPRNNPKLPPLKISVIKPLDNPTLPSSDEDNANKPGENTVPSIGVKHVEASSTIFDDSIAFGHRTKLDPISPREHEESCTRVRDEYRTETPPTAVHGDIAQTTPPEETTITVPSYLESSITTCKEHTSKQDCDIAAVQHIDLPPGSKSNKLAIFLLNVGLVCILFVYAFIGGATLVILEHPNEVNQYQHFVSAQEVLKEAIANLTGIDRNMYEVEINDILETFETQMKDVVCDHGVDIKGEYKWTFWSSVFFSATVISTIGKLNHAVFS